MTIKINNTWTVDQLLHLIEILVCRYWTWTVFHQYKAILPLYCMRP